MPFLSHGGVAKEIIELPHEDFFVHHIGQLRQDLLMLLVENITSAVWLDPLIGFEDARYFASRR